jgi:3'-5' exoribonuclease
MRRQSNPSASGSIFAGMLVRDFEDGQAIDQALLVREAEVRDGRNGAFLKLSLADRSGTVSAVVWDVTREQIACAGTGSVVRVAGRFSVHPRYGRQLTVAQIRDCVPGDYRMEDLLDGPPHPLDQMEGDVRSLLETIRNPFLAQLLDRVFGPESPTWPQFRDAPAAKFFHQAYKHGLLEHSLSVAQAVHTIAATFPGIDREVAVTGALLHDIGKLEAYTSDPLAIDLTDLGKLQGEIPLGYYRVRRLIEDIPGFPEETARAVLHIILSHHGQLEHGSPVVPATREATLVHMIDNLGGKLGSFDRIEKALADGEAWSGFDRAIGGGAYFGQRAA